jgi:hypothetical protein
MTTRRAVLLIVAGVIGLAVLGLAGVIVYVNNFSPAAPYLRGLKNLAVARALDREVTNRSDYTAPSASQVSDEQAARFTTVEAAVESALGARIALLQRASEALLQRQKADRGLTVHAALKEVGELGSLLVEAKRAQVQALNSAAFSKGEFEWVRQQLYAAAGVDLAQIDLKALGSFGTVEDLVEINRPRTAAPGPETRRRSERHAESLRRWRPLAFFGL